MERSVNRDPGRSNVGRLIVVVTALLLAVVACETDADNGEIATDDPDGETFEITLSTPLSERGMMNGTVWWAEEIEDRTDGRVTFEIFFDGSLVSATDGLPAIRDGRVDAAFLSDPYWPAEFPLWNVIGIPFETSDPHAAAHAFYDLYETNESFRAEFENAGVHLLHVIPYSQTVMGASDPIAGLDDISGLRFRAIGHFATALDRAGADTTAMDPGELYEAIQRGVMDGYAGFPFDVAPEFGLHEVAPYTAHTRVGHYASAGIGISLDLWNDMPEDLRSIITEVSDELQSSVAVDELMAMEVEACDRLLDEGGEILVWSDADIDEWQDLLGEDIVERWREATLEQGVQEDEVDAFYSEFHEAYDQHRQDTPYVDGLEACAS